MSNLPTLPRLYGELAAWWPILSDPADYAAEADLYRKAILSASSFRPKTLLELGAGGGNNTSHLKKHFRMTLVDQSSEMIRISQSLNPECEHLLGDMRTIRLNRRFDAVFIHDAIMCMTTDEDPHRAIHTAYVHCKPGGVSLFAPDYVHETFRSSTIHGGHDEENRGLRYLEWTWDPDPHDTSYISDFAYLLKDQNDVRCEYDRHVCGLFKRQTWIQILTEVGFQPQVNHFELSEIEPGTCELFLGLNITE